MNNLSKADIANQLQSLVTAMHEFACSLYFGDDRTEAFERYEVLRRLQRCGSAGEMLSATNPLLCPGIPDNAEWIDFDEDNPQAIPYNSKPKSELSQQAEKLAVKTAELARKISNASVIPSDCVLVPTEPTEDMIIAGFESEPDEVFSEEKTWEAYQAMSGCEQAAYRARLCWAAMIKAAPKQENF